jgi:Ca-activated chloride channel family protein
MLEARQGRRLVVLLSDGIDPHSALHAAEVVEHARRSQTMVYWIRMLQPAESIDERDQPEMVSAWRMPEEYRDQRRYLHELVELSGGRMIPVRSTAEIESVFTEILRELRAQYALGYYPDRQHRDGRWHRLKVKVGAPGVDVRTAAGYLDD